MAKPTWITVNPDAGSGSGTVNVSASTHTGRTQRSGKLTYIASGVVDIEQTVTQAAKAEFVEVDNVSAPKGGGNVTITGKSNSKSLTFALGAGDIEISLPSSYTAGGATVTNGADISGDPGASAQYDFALTLAIPENTTIDEREQVVSVTAAGGQSTSSTIKQAAGDPTLSIDPTTVSLNAAGNAVSVSVTSNTNWSVE